MAEANKRDFHHPYEPYPIQNDFMNAVYDCLDQGKVGIFESPTGTGKSLSLICGSLTWLRDYQRRKFDGEYDCNDSNEPAWMVQHAQEQKQRVAFHGKVELSRRLARIREQEDRAREKYEDDVPPLKKQKQSHNSLKQEDNEATFILDEYESDDESKKQITTKTCTSTILSSKTTALMDRLGMSVDGVKEDNDCELEDELKIFFCSRTHSQLNQFANELRRVAIPPSIPLDLEGTAAKSADLTKSAGGVRFLTLGSRKNLCINPKVSRLGNATAITERCLELQQPGASSDSKCPYLPSKDSEVLVNDFRDHALAKVRDIEDFGSLGKKIGICPYYATRAAVRPAEMITLPYPLLLQKSAREALDLSLKGHIIVIDEAHNLIDAITSLHSVSVSHAQLKAARANLGVYLQKFRNRLKGKNRVYITQLVRLIDSLSTFLETQFQRSNLEDSQVSVGDLLTGKGVDQINLYKLKRYLHESKLAYKVESYTSHVSNVSPSPSCDTPEKEKALGHHTTLPVLMQVQTFIMALTNPAAEGRFFYSKQSKLEEGQTGALLKYLLLDPTQVFKDIVAEARAVVLAGGTMSPMSDYTNHLFHYLPFDRISLLSCGHVIPSSNLLARPVSRGPNAVEFEFSFNKRNSKDMILELGRSIIEFSKLIPQGVVVFFPSYAYLDTVMQTWKSPNKPESDTPSIWARFTYHKRVFVEPRSTPSKSQLRAEMVPAIQDGDGRQERGSTVDAILGEYTSHIDSGQGALLFAVMGGSLSEGINFSDGLGRGIAVVGLPYPNAQSSEWKARLEYVERRTRSSDGSNVVGGNAAKEYYENVCMRAVNQSVGRAIRHKNDYAAILLLDKRYEREHIQAKLPGWIRASMSASNSFGDTTAALGNFFTSKA